MIIPTINLKEKIKEINGRPYHPIDVAKVNNQVVRIALYKGDYHWHEHTNEDELFYVLKGKMTIQMKYPYSNIILSEGQITVVPKGVQHCPTSEEDTYVLMFEPIVLESKGN